MGVQIEEGVLVQHFPRLVDLGLRLELDNVERIGVGRVLYLHGLNDLSRRYVPC